MFVRPSRRAWAPLVDKTEGKIDKRRKADTNHQLLINEMNFYYRIGDGTCYQFSDEDGKALWPILILRLLSPALTLLKSEPCSSTTARTSTRTAATATCSCASPSSCA